MRRQTRLAWSLLSESNFDAKASRTYPIPRFPWFNRFPVSPIYSNNVESLILLSSSGFSGRSFVLMTERGAAPVSWRDADYPFKFWSSVLKKESVFLLLSKSFRIFAGAIRKERRHWGERLSFDPSENLENSKYAGEKSESCFSCSCIYTAHLVMGVSSHIYLQVWVDFILTHTGIPGPSD
jgi:hypothetical protein